MWLSYKIFTICEEDFTSSSLCHILPLGEQEQHHQDCKQASKWSVVYYVKKMYFIIPTEE